VTPAKDVGSVRGDKRAGGTDGSGIRVISRATDILSLLADHPDGLSLRDIARRVALPRSTVQRIVSALEETNLVIGVSAAGGFRLGPGLTLLARSVRQFDIASIARPLIQQLVSELGETVDVSILSHGKAVVVDQIPGTHPLLAVSQIGSSLPLHATASGKALLATLSEEELAPLRQHLDLPPLTRNTIVTWDRLDRELEIIRSTGVALDGEEYLLGLSAAATVLRGSLGETAAISLPVPTDRFVANEQRLVKTLVDRCGAVQRRL
jgi:DNA-binding IclR family transcriptional regulator